MPSRMFSRQVREVRPKLEPQIGDHRLEFQDLGLELDEQRASQVRPEIHCCELIRPSPAEPPLHAAEKASGTAIRVRHLVSCQRLQPLRLEVVRNGEEPEGPSILPQRIGPALLVLQYE